MTPARIRALEERHARLETALASELARPAPNFARVRELKSRKLALKDELAGLTRPPITA